MALHLTLHRDALSNDSDAVGRWQYEGGKVFDQDRQLGYYAVTRRVASQTSDAQATAQLTMTLFFLGRKPSENIMIQGSHDVRSGTEVGSVRAASASQTAHIGKNFIRVGETITIG
ncbi:MAG TPA: hypothetical protein VHN14_09070 [Kofleriaceae bacterium]|jgi:hypothetical protein|nr:hypothetical protein [Kofleriaceae bacterium]